MRRESQLGAVGVDLTGAQALGDPGVEGGSAAVRAAARTQPHLAGQAGDVLALGQDRALVAVDLLDGPAGTLGDLLGRHAGPDHRLDVLGAQAAGDLDLELAEPRTVAPCRGTECLVERDGEAVALVVGQQQVQSVLVDADEPEVLHGWVSR